MWRSKSSLPVGEAMCRTCRKAQTAQPSKGAKAKRPKSPAAPRPLRSVGPDEKPEDEVVDDDPIATQRERLVQIRNRVMAAIDNPATAARDLSALISRELELTAKIHQMDMASGKSTSVVAKTPNEPWDKAAY